jgi:glycolate dehydrogenase FAD-linked subunit
MFSIDTLSQVIPEDCVVTDPGLLESYRHDEAEHAPSATPLAVVRPRRTDDVVAIVRYCAAEGVPLVTRGAGTGLSGGANAVAGSVVLSTERMNRIIEVNTTERFAVVQPGVVNDDLRKRCAEDGLWYPPDPASSPWSTIGGNVSTNAGGLCCVKYGVTRDYVLELEVVTGRGEVVRFGGRTAKNAAGYDLRCLMVGSEGTLGVITEATMRIRPRQPARHTVVGYFGSIVDAGRAVAAISAAGIIPAVIELVDRTCLSAVDAWKRMGLSVEAEVLLLGRTDGPGAAEEAQGMVDHFIEAGASWAARSTDEQEAEALFQARRLAYPAIERLGSVLTEDVCVPLAMLPEMLARIERTAARNDITIANIAHVGDGNLHPLLLTPVGDDAAHLRARRAFDELLTAAIDVGGTVTGEHGVGLLKREGLKAQLAPRILDFHRGIKAVLDPANIFNPDKIFAARP